MSRDGAKSCARLSPHRLRLAERVLRAGGIVAHATEGVWGLACDPLDPRAVLRLLELKRRKPGRGLILIGAEADDLAVFVARGAQDAWNKATQSWPAPITWLLPAAPDVPRWLTGNHDTIALRQTAHADSAALCRAFGGALVSTSANVSGHPPVRSAWQARARLRRGVDMIVSGVPDNPGRSSSIRDARDGRTLRQS